jgi:NADPH-dependent 2,4-dienoyl-CoA reductase/sulfur reductase-like enzyme
MRIVIVGGVAGGMSAAARARRLSESAEIIVLERGQHPSFANCGLPYYVGGEIEDKAKLLVQTPQSLRASLNLDVRIGHNVTAIDPETKTVTAHTADDPVVISYDALILAPGARALTPPIPGIDSPRVTTLRTVDDAVALREQVTSQIGSAGQDANHAHAVVIGAGFIGLEAAEALALAGYKVSVIERAPHVLPPAEVEVASQVRLELERLGMDVYEDAEITSITNGGSNPDMVNLGTGETIPAHIIVLSAGVTPDTDFLDGSGVELDNRAIVTDAHGRTSVQGIWAVGDATVQTDKVTGARRPVMLAGPANRAGRLVADDILNPDTAREIPTTLGTAIVRVGELTAAMTGANSRSLTAAGIAFHTLHLHPNNHAGYFPGATGLRLTVHVREDDGLLLGAQIVGNEGADKRIDVLATAIRAGLTAPELIDLDLAYAPPYGSAKDPVNFAGMVAENVLTDQLALWYPHEYLSFGDDALVLDVRTAAEWATGHLPTAHHVPHTELRDRLAEVSELAQGRRIRVTCQSGVRSYIAHRILTEAGFDSASLSGGMITYKAIMGIDDLVTGD